MIEISYIHAGIFLIVNNLVILVIILFTKEWFSR